MAHPLLKTVLKRLSSEIADSFRNSLIFVPGLTGVGKTTVRRLIEETLTQELEEDLKTDRERIPVVSVEVVAPEYGKLNWTNHYFKPTLRVIQDVLIGRKRRLGPSPNPEAAPYDLLGPRATGAVYYEAVVEGLTHGVQGCPHRRSAAFSSGRPRTQRVGLRRCDQEHRQSHADRSHPVRDVRAPGPS